MSKFQFFELPDDISVCIVNEFLGLEVRVMLDTAVCNYTKRFDLMRVFQHKAIRWDPFERDDYHDYLYTWFLSWVEKRQMCLASLYLKLCDFSLQNQLLWSNLNLREVKKLSVHLKRLVASLSDDENDFKLISNIDLLMLSNVRALQVYFMDDDILNYIAKHNNCLIVADFSGFMHSGALIEFFKANPLLEILNLNGFEINDATLTALAKCNNLQQFVTGDGGNVDIRLNTIADFIVKCKKLTKLELNGEDCVRFHFSSSERACLIEDFPVTHHQLFFDTVVGLKIISFKFLSEHLSDSVIETISRNNSELNTFEFIYSSDVNVRELMRLCDSVENLRFASGDGGWFTPTVTPEDLVHICETHPKACRKRYSTSTSSKFLILAVSRYWALKTVRMLTLKRLKIILK